MSDGNRGKKKKVHVVLHRWAGRSFTSRHAGVCVCGQKTTDVAEAIFYTWGGKRDAVGVPCLAYIESRLRHRTTMSNSQQTLFIARRTFVLVLSIS